MSKTTYEESQKVTTKIKIAYSLGALGGLLLNGIFNGSLVKYYTDKVFLAPGYIGLAYLLFAIWNAINDPLFGHLSDNTRTKLGRRIPYMRIMSFIYGLSFLLIWFPPNVSQEMLFIYLLLVMLAFDTCYTIWGLCICALLPELSLDLDERTGLALYSTALGAIGTAISFLIPFAFLTGTGPAGPFQFICIILAVIATVLFFISSFTIKEREDFCSEEKEPLGLIDAIKYCFKNKAFIYFVIFNFVAVLIQNIILTAVLYYTQYVLNLSGSSTYIPLIIIFLGFLVTYAFTPRLIGEYGIRKLLLLMGCIGVIGFLIIAIPNLYTAIFGLTLVASSIAVYAIMVNPMVGDIADVDEVEKTGLRREGAYFGINALVTKPAISLGVFIVTFMLTYTEYFPKLTEYLGQPQSLGVKMGIQLTMGVIPAILLAIGLIAVYFYPLHGDYYKKIKEELKNIHLAKKKFT